MQIRPIGILLAAGRGRRMGCVKQLLPWPEASSASTLVETCFRLAHEHNLEQFIRGGFEVREHPQTF